MKNTGIVCVTIGIAIMLFLGVRSMTRKKMAESGSSYIGQKVNHPFPILPTTGAILLGGGILLLVNAGSKGKNPTQF